jgi:hypothetical protein
MTLTEKWCRMDSSVLAQGLVTHSCEHGNELLDSTEVGEFVDQLSEY